MKIIKENEILNRIRRPPKKLYYEGNIDLLKSNCIAIVGSRKCSEYGKKIAEKISYKLAENGLTIVSGLAIRNRYTCTFRSIKI